MPKKIAFPAELQVLNPELHRMAVPIGAECYEMVPLPAGKAEAVGHELAALAGDVLKTILDNLTGTANENQKAAALIKGVLESLTGDQRIQKILAAALDLSLEEVQAGATIPQMHHALACLWKLNFDFDAAPEETAKNFNSLLATLGLKKNSDPAYQWANFTLGLLISRNRGSDAECVQAILSAAIELGLMQPSVPAKTAAAPAPQSTPSSPAIAGTPAST